MLKVTLKRNIKNKKNSKGFHLRKKIMSPNEHPSSYQKQTEDTPKTEIRAPISRNMILLQRFIFVSIYIGLIVGLTFFLGLYYYFIWAPVRGNYSKHHIYVGHSNPVFHPEWFFDHLLDINIVSFGNRFVSLHHFIIHLTIAYTHKYCCYLYLYLYYYFLTIDMTGIMKK